MSINNIELYRGEHANLPETITDGAVYVATDDKKVFFDFNGERIQFNTSEVFLGDFEDLLDWSNVADLDLESSIIDGQKLIVDTSKGIVVQLKPIDYSQEELEGQRICSFDLKGRADKDGQRLESITLNNTTYIGETVDENGEPIKLTLDEAINTLNNSVSYNIRVQSPDKKKTKFYQINIIQNSKFVNLVDFVRYTQDIFRHADGPEVTNENKPIFQTLEMAEEKYSKMSAITPSAAMTDTERNYYKNLRNQDVRHIIYKGYLSSELLNEPIDTQLQALSSSETSYIYEWNNSTPLGGNSSSKAITHPVEALTCLKIVRDTEDWDRVCSRFYGYIDSKDKGQVYVVFELYNARIGEALIGREDINGTLKPLDSEVDVNDQYAIIVMDNNGNVSKARVTNWSNEYDNNGHLLPLEFEVELDEKATSMTISTQLEFERAWVSVSDEKARFSDYKQGYKLFTFGYVDTLYIHVLDEDKGNAEHNRNSFDSTSEERPPLYGRRYVLHLKKRIKEGN